MAQNYTMHYEALFATLQTIDVQALIEQVRARAATGL